MSKCPVCGSVYAPAPFHIYKIRISRKGYATVCSWKCQRAHEKELEEQKKLKKQKNERLWSHCEKCGREIVVGETCFTIGDDDYCSDCCKKADTKERRDDGGQ